MNNQKRTFHPPQSRADCVALCQEIKRQLKDIEVIINKALIASENSDLT